MTKMSSTRVGKTTKRLLSRRLLLSGLSLFSFTGILTAPLRALAGSWEEISNSHGIRVLRKEMPGTPLYAFRGTAMVDAPMEKVMWVLADEQHRKEWVDRLEKSIVLESHGPYDSVLYQHFKAPAIVSDRDFVYRARAHSLANGTAVLKIASVKHPKAPPTVGVRAELKETSYILKPHGEKTLVEVNIQTDPKGALPNWLVNMITKTWPRNTLTALRKQVRKPFVGRLAAPPVK